ncbi:MAG: D-alanyl-D-alanine carboxypeptidase/D-alanyl-D-alanine-endopeptidase [Sedimentisphaerales bacterium]|nr:D-alanyl-D-alanine carboxypeptidase/D-alanyl-D-alanine-endopeptidase [Sedimentisphaerales bacterium]
MNTQIKKLFVAAVLTVSLIGIASAGLTEQINGIINQPSQKKVQFSICVAEANTGQMVYQYNETKPLLPASNMKVITTAAALKYLGPDYQYKTQIGLCGDTLIVFASGDPLLGDKITDAEHNRKPGWIFESIAAALKQNGVTAVNDIIVDSTVFDDQRVHPNWPAKELNRWYACEVAGLNFNANCIDISAENINGKTTVFIDPPNNFIKIINKVTPISNGKSILNAYRTKETNKIVVEGKCRDKMGPFAIAIEQPPALFGSLLAENLTKAGIAVNGRIIGGKKDENCDFKLLYEHTTPITDCLKRCNRDSFGLAAESLLKTIAARSEPDKKNGSWAKGRTLISQYLLELGIPEEEFYIDDGSGLSKENRLSANTLTAVLLDVYKSRQWPLFRDSLAVGGVDGTITNRFKEEKYKGRILGKTGYIAGVRAFSGVCNTASGDYIFSILTNNSNPESRNAINDIVKAITDEGDSQPYSSGRSLP